MTVEPVADLRDLVWAPAHLGFSNGGDTVALIPVRYAGSTEGGDAALQLARRTDWIELADGQYRGLGQRVLATDADELPLLEVRKIGLDAAAAASPDAADPAA
jgi:type VI secretion system protein ImpE